MAAIINQLSPKERKNLFEIRKSHIYGDFEGSINLSKELNEFMLNGEKVYPNHLLISNIVSNVEISYKSYHKGILNVHKINDLRFINKFLERINHVLGNGDFFICCVETFQARKARKKIYKIPIIRNFYFLYEFIFRRLFPKIKYTQRLFFNLTGGRDRIISKAEALGRLVSCGFEILEYQNISGLLYIKTRKKSDPFYDMNPSYGLIYSMPRVGKNTRIIKVHKLRTMHPYSEYLQDYMFQKFGSNNGDKILNDFRVSNQARFLRRFWIDELPMLFNLIKGDIKLIGVRPLSLSKFKMYPKHAQIMRVKSKPGLIPPFYADLPKSFDELVNSELKYLEAYRKNPFKTDLDYFIKAINNIIFKGARSF